MDDLTLTSAPTGITVELGISGMTCTGCSSSIEGALVALAGVRSASVDHVSGTAVVLLDPAVDAEGFAFEADAAVHDAGYTLESARIAAGARSAGRSGGCGCGARGACGEGKAKEAAATADGCCGGGGGGCC